MLTSFRVQCSSILLTIEIYRTVVTLDLSCKCSRQTASSFFPAGCQVNMMLHAAVDRIVLMLK